MNSLLLLHLSLALPNGLPRVPALALTQGYTHGAGALQGGRKRAGGRDSLYGNSMAGGSDAGSVYRGHVPLEEELEGTQQLLGRIRGNRIRKQGQDPSGVSSVRWREAGEREW